MRAKKTIAKAEDAEDDSGKDAPAQQASEKPALQAKSKLARVTGIRHWSTPDYTRVTIDLEQDVKYQSQRIDHPGRIVFDLLETQLASTLVGKSFDVDDGFLRKIRVAQFQPDKTRVVLEVDKLSDYQAFLLPNPTRLIVDIRDRETNKSKTGRKAAISDDDRAAQLKAETKKDVSSAADISLQENEAGVSSAPEDDVTSRPAPPKAATAETTKSVAATKAINNGLKKKVIVEAVEEEAEAKSDAPDTKTTAKSSTSINNPERPKARATKGKRKPLDPEYDVREAAPTASGDRSLIRALGLKIGKIVIDPGHGGHDTGTIGPNGLQEKDLVLEVSRRLGKLLEARLGAEVVFTRSDDTFIPLETRTAIANREEADLFVSVHANSSSDRNARGVETYYLNFTSSPEALEVAARENAVSDKSIHELQDLVKKIALKEKIEESREFATDVQRSLHSGLAVKSPGIRDRGVKKAPFIVLIGANMPSILAEISFVSNPGDERRLETAAYRQRVAESLYKGISKYVGGLSGVKVASRKDASQLPVSSTQ